MSGTSIPEIYCCKIEMDRMNVYLASTRKGAFRIGLSLEKDPGCITFFRRLLKGAWLLENSGPNRPLIRAVEAAFLNKRSEDMPLPDISCTPFQWSVFTAIATIPFGETRTYGEVASMVGRPRAARAVGQALGRNPLPLIFP